VKNFCFKIIFAPVPDLNLVYRSWHCLRHSCATNIIGKTGDYQLARRWLGHTSMLVIERYVHTHQALVRKATQTKKDKKGFKRI
jgi:integrase